MLLGGNMLSGLLITIISFLVFLFAFYIKKRKTPELNEIIDIFFYVGLFLGGINVIYFSVYQKFLFEEIPQNLYVLIALSGILLCYMGLDKFYELIKKRK